MYFLYNLVLRLATLFLVPWAAYRTIRGRLPGLGQRLGWIDGKEFSSASPVVWLHAVSVGEVRAASALVKELKSRIPNIQIVITSSTEAGWNAARQLLSSSDRVLYPPFDFIWVCRRFLQRIRPSTVVVLETELWPNLFRETKRFGASLLLANGRISGKTFPRYRTSRFFWRHVLECPDTLFVQSPAEARRFQEIGAAPEKICVAGNLKFASQPAATPFSKILHGILRDQHIEPVIVAGSTMPGEEQYLLECFQQLVQEFPRLGMILAPRHPQRFAEVAEQVRALGIPCQLRSQWTAATKFISHGILLLDSIGELGSMYELATVAYVGGTLVATGGHNILEPACCARPIVIGPSMANFQEIADEFLQDASVAMSVEHNIRVGAIIQIPDAGALAPVFRYLFQNPPACRQLGEAAQKRWRRNLSGVAPVVDEIEKRLTSHSALRNQPAPLPRRETVGAIKAE